MSPHRLKKDQGADLLLGVPQVSRVNPEFFPRALQIIVIASYVEFSKTTALAGLFGTKHRAVAAILESIRGSRKRDEALMVAAAELIEEPDLSLVRKVMAEASAVETHRNRLAHYLWGIRESAPNDLILVQSSLFAPWVASEAEQTAFLTKGIKVGVKKKGDAWGYYGVEGLMAFLKVTRMQRLFDPTKAWVYRLSEMDALVTRADRTNQMLESLELLGGSTAEADEGRAAIGGLLDAE